MERFKTLTSVAACLPINNIDTDMIIPKQFLKTIKRTGLSEGLFYEMRYDESGKRIDDFVLHNSPYDKAEILIAGQNFGCGSSREHAPWALLDFGIKCVIAESFADIFYNNCFKNGILPISLDKSEVLTLLKDAKSGGNAMITVDLENNEIVRPSGNKIFFDVDDYRRERLLQGLDDIAITLKKSDKIDGFELENRKTAPWLYA